MAKKENKIWKFFKPIVLKLAVALIIFFVFAPIVRVDSGIKCESEPCDSESDASLLIYCFSLLEGEKVSGFYYMNIALGIIVSYLLSCFIVVFIEFLKKKFKDI